MVYGWARDDRQDRSPRHWGCIHNEGGFADRSGRSAGQGHFCSSRASPCRRQTMNAPKILFPTDFSTSGETALALATELAKGRGAKLVIVHVEEPPMAYGGGEMYY